MSELDTRQAAELLGYSRDYFVDIVCKKPGFPRPYKAPTPWKRRWLQSDLLRWAQGQRKAA